MSDEKMPESTDMLGVILDGPKKQDARDSGA
jgi:hypothetical protein